MDGRRFVQPKTLIADRKRNLCVRRLLSEFVGRAAATPVEDTKLGGALAGGEEW